MKVLVTGGAGFIGSNFVHELVRRGGHEIVVLDKLTYAGNLANLAGLLEELDFVRGDVAEPSEVGPLFERHRFDSVVHFAAESHVDRSIQDSAPFLRTNVIGTQVLLDAVRRSPVRRFLHISTDEVYGEMAPGQTAEELSPLRPSSPYAASKAAGDHLVLAAARTHGLPVVIARPSNNYGPRQYPEKMIPLFLTNALGGRKLPVYGDGLQERDWLFVEDCVGALLALLEAPALEHAVYNVSVGEPRPNMDVVKLLLSVLEEGEELIQHVTDRLGHDRRYAPDSSRIRGELRWRPRVGFEEGLRRTVAWYLENKDWWRGRR